jgi:fructokinase
VRLANDANCFALSEAVDGAAAGAEVVFGVILGTGVGGGIVVRGQVIAGANAIAGEWGHNPMPGEHHHADCYCGRKSSARPGAAATNARAPRGGWLAGCGRHRPPLVPVWGAFRPSPRAC